MGPPVFAACRLIYDPDKGFGEELVAAEVDMDVDDKAAASRRLVDFASSDGDVDNSSADVSTSSQEASSANSSASSSSGDEPRVTRLNCCSLFCCYSCGLSAGALICIGIVLFLLGVGAFVKTPYQILLTERLKMVPGLPPYEWWKTPPDEVLLRFYVFNVSNSEDFMSGKADKLEMDEIGPFVFREKLQHSNVRFHDNNTMSYVATRTVIYLPEMNTLDMDATIVVPNLAVLGMASYLADAPFLTKIAFNMLLRSLGSHPLSTITIRNYMWNMTDPLVNVGKTLAPGLVPVDNIGALQNIYADFVDDVAVFIGAGNDRKFFTMDRFRGNRRLGHWPGELCDSVENATEGVSYHQNVQREDELRYFRKTLCRVMPLYFAKDERHLGMDAMRFELPASVFDRVGSGETEEDCFTLEGTTPLPSGLSDVSPCYFDFPVVASLPHFYGAIDELRENVGGMRPDKAKHGSYVLLEPNTGIPMEAKARSQSNLMVKDSGGVIKLVDKFAGLTIPMFWAEYHQVGLPWYISGLMIFTVLLLPVLQTIIAALLVGGGLYQTWRGTRRLLLQQRRFSRSLRPVLMAARVVSRAGSVVHPPSSSAPAPLSSYSSLDLLPSSGASS